ncbi:flavin-containing monooxygenase [Smaragdicoccus niigatensis]|uniref:flavin-containing monooxygenase n=1 Tax=Smaragdicoccus niigatensis TaxID=359359 RepID=UPI0003741B89|nr:NAD(P)/FAD-dependent oxidoreductase [Smaragdicoccus niigatensis]
MATQHIDTLIIGAGQAGLSTGYQLRRRGRECLIVDGNSRLGDNWRMHYDSLRVFTPAKVSGLAGLPFPAAPNSYPTKDELGQYLEQYAIQFDLPVRLNTRIDSLTFDGTRYLAGYDGETITADNVVVATGPYGRLPNIPDFAKDLDPAIRQLHSGDYKRPGQMQPGPVLVVGASHSGADIAYEIAAEHPTILVGRDPGQFPAPLESWRGRHLFPVVLFAFKHVLTRRTPIGRKVRAEMMAHHGGPMLRVQRQDLAARKVERHVERVTGIADGKPALADGTVLDVTNIVWATGFRHDYSWLKLPVFDDHGWPIEYRGVVEHQPGLYFCGLFFQFAFSSSMIPGAGRDAEFIAQQIARRRVAVPA